MASKELLQLPLEVVYQILSLLSPFDLAACQLVSKHLHDIIRGSVTLQYIISLALAKADDNPCSLASLAEKLEDIKSSEAAWSSFQPKFTVSLPIVHDTSGIYDLSGGTYLLGNADRRTLQCLMLPTKIDDSLRWDKIFISKTIIDMGFCVFEHDLIAVITTTTRLIEPSQTEVYVLEMFLLEYSTGKPHPKAKESCIFIMTSELPRPSLACEIVGENLVLILNFFHPSQPPDRVFIWNWRQNVLKTTLIAPRRTYSGVIYLTEDIILLPNLKSNAFEVFRIPEKPIAEPLNPFLSFSLPSLANGVQITHIICRAEPNPIANVSLLNKRRRAQDRAAACMSETDPFAPRRGFLASADEAICIFQIRFTGGPVILVQGGLDVHFDMGHSYTIYIHRKTFLDLIRKHEIAHENDATSQKDAGLDGPSQAESIPWAQWGPSASRWFSADVMPIKWITTSAGQRCAVIHDGAGSRGSPIMIIDFNPHNVRKIKAKMRTATQAAKEREERTRATEEGVWNTTEYIEGSLDDVLREESFADGDDTNSFFQSLTDSEAADGMDVDDDDSWFTDDGNEVAIEQQTQLESNSDIIPAFVLESASEGSHNPRAGFAAHYNDPGRALYRVFDAPTIVDSAGTFAEIVEGHLPCVTYISERRYNYDGVLLDEERIIGIKTDANDRMSAIDIMYFG